MKKRECPSCAMMVEATRKTCPICQYEFPEQGSIIKWIAILLILAMIFGYFFLDRLF